MNVSLEQLIPEYPPTDDKRFQEKIAKKKEFAELRLEPKEKLEGKFYKHQKILSRFVSPNTVYDEILVYHGLGTGKCVHPKTRVFVNGKNQEIELVWKSYGSSEPRFDKEGGEWKIPTGSISVSSFDGRKVQKSFVSRLYRQRVREKLVKICLSDGSCLRITKAHHLLTENGWSNDFSTNKYVCIPKTLSFDIKKYPESTMNFLTYFVVYGTFVLNQGVSPFFTGISPPIQTSTISKDTGKFVFVFDSMDKFLSFQRLSGEFFIENRITTDRDISPIKMAIKKGGEDVEVTVCAFRSPSLERHLKMSEFDFTMKNGLPHQLLTTNSLSFIKTYIMEKSFVDKDGSIIVEFSNRECCLDFSLALRKIGVHMQINGTIGRIHRRFSLKLEEKIGMDLLETKEIHRPSVYPLDEAEYFPFPEILENMAKKLKISPSDLLQGKRKIDNSSDAREVLLSLIRARNGETRNATLEACDKVMVRKFVDELSKILEKEVWFCPIISVEEEDYEGFVYDFEVQKYHNYVAEGVICHNTCTAIAVYESFAQSKDMEKPLVFASTILQENFRKDLTMCASDSFPKPPGDPTEKHYRRALKRMTDAKFEFWTPTTFYNKILKDFVRDGAIDWNLVVQRYSGRLVIIDEVQNLRQDLEDEETGKQGKEQRAHVYKFMHNFLHRIKNSKVLLLSGTPIVNEIWDLSYVMNLILPLDEQLPEDKSFERLLSNPEGRKKLEKAFRGRISYLRAAAAEVVRIDEGSVLPWENPEKFSEWKRATKSSLSQDSRPWTEHLKLYPSAMSKYQTEAVENAEKEVLEAKGKTSKKGGGFHRFGLDSSLFVWPEQKGVPPVELYGTRGFERFATKKGKKETYSISPSLQAEIKQNLGKYSSKFEVIVRNILENPDDLIFVYSSSVKSGGALLLGLVLKMFGMKQANTGSVSSDSSVKRFAILQGGMDKNVIQSILGSYASPENKNAKKIQVLIASKILAQGVTLKNVRQVHILTPHWQSPQIEQAIARAIRLGSHDELPKSKRNVKVFRHVAVQGKERNGKIWYLPEITPDIFAYKTAEKKAIKNAKVLRMMKRNAFDCPLNYARNVDPKDKDYSEVCDFDKCDYGCNTAEPEERNPERYGYIELDSSTYNLFYADPEKAGIAKKLVELFSSSTYASFSTIKKEIGGDGEILLLEVLSKLVDDRVTILDRYGFPSYLAESNDVFYLVKTFGEEGRHFGDVFYVENPLISQIEGTEAVFDIEIFKTSKDIVRTLCQDPLSKFRKKFSGLDYKVRIALFEKAFSLLKTGKVVDENHKKQLEYVTELYKKYAYKVTLKKKNYLVHLLSQDLVSTASYDIARKGYKANGKTRIYDQETNSWYTSPSELEENIVNEIKKQVTKKRKEALSGESLLGIYLAKDPSVFRVKTDLGGKKGLGVVCKTSIKIPLLFQIIMELAKIGRERGNPNPETLEEELESEEIPPLLQMVGLNYDEMKERGYKDEDMVLAATLIKQNPQTKKGKKNVSLRKDDLCDFVEKELKRLDLVRTGV